MAEHFISQQGAGNQEHTLDPVPDSSSFHLQPQGPVPKMQSSKRKRDAEEDTDAENPPAKFQKPNETGADATTKSSSTSVRKGSTKHRKGLTQHNPDGQLQWRNPRTGRWENAVYHNDIRGKLLQLASNNFTLSYDTQRSQTDKQFDQTAYHPEQREWSEERQDWPKIRDDILNRLEKSEYKQKYTHDAAIWYFEGLVVLDPNDYAMLWFEDLPVVLSSAVEGWLLEAISRLDSRIDRRDFWARMPPHRILRHGKLAGQMGLSGIGNRKMRFRENEGLLAWGEREGSEGQRDYVKTLLPADAVAANTSRGGKALSKAEKKTRRDKKKTKESQQKQEKDIIVIDDDTEDDKMPEQEIKHRRGANKKPRFSYNATHAHILYPETADQLQDFEYGRQEMSDIQSYPTQQLMSSVPQPEFIEQYAVEDEEPRMQVLDNVQQESGLLPLHPQWDARSEDVPNGFEPYTDTRSYDGGYLGTGLPDMQEFIPNESGMDFPGHPEWPPEIDRGYDMFDPYGLDGAFVQNWEDLDTDGNIQDVDNAKPLTYSIIDDDLPQAPQSQPRPRLESVWPSSSRVGGTSALTASFVEATTASTYQPTAGPLLPLATPDLQQSFQQEQITPNLPRLPAYEYHCPKDDEGEPSRTSSEEWRATYAQAIQRGVHPITPPETDPLQSSGQGLERVQAEVQPSPPVDYRGIAPSNAAQRRSISRALYPARLDYMRQLQVSGIPVGRQPILDEDTSYQDQLRNLYTSLEEQWTRYGREVLSVPILPAVKRWSEGWEDYEMEEFVWSEE